VGPLPPELGALDELRELNLETNALTGELPPGLCRPGSQLRVLNLRNNGFKGRATQVAGCGALTQLDLSNNQLTG
jgi:Leucine-rich repeat (LRR) protein